MRLPARVTVAAALTALVALGPLGAHAFADEPESDQLWLNTPYELSLPAGGTQSPGEARVLDVGLYHDNADAEVVDGRVHVDASGIAAVAEIEWPSNCAPTGPTAVCSVPAVSNTGDADDIRLTVRAAPGAAAGARGTVRYSATATGGPDGTLTAYEQETTVSVAAGPDLTPVGVHDVEHAVLGSSLTQPVAVVNRGTEAAHGFTLEMNVPYGLDFDARRPECQYRTTGGGNAPITFATCTYDTVLEPGETFALPGGVGLAVREHAMDERFGVNVTLGGGATDIDTGNDSAYAAVRADNTADFRVRGATVRGAAGETVTARLRFRNTGPAWVANLGSGDPVASVGFVVPRGATVTGYPEEECHPTTLAGEYYEGTTGAPRYACSLPIWAAPDAVRDFAFALRVDTVLPGATGAVTLTPPYGDTFPFDPKPGNNKAKVVLNPGVKP
ncbi:hypothetical protein ACIRF8_31800 [Streptomyces sp. NPDC102406]|uniref:hypothetical protein n=1 Tax=Streptomyces sp. NPDC102406 TaxID=3366171 RepID=UPI0037F901E7